MLSRLSAVWRPSRVALRIQRVDFTTCGNRLNRSTQPNEPPLVSGIAARSRTAKAEPVEKRGRAAIKIDSPPPPLEPPRISEEHMTRRRKVGGGKTKAAAVTKSKQRRSGRTVGASAFNAARRANGIEGSAPGKGGASDVAIDDDDDEKLVDEESKQLMQLLKEEALRREEEKKKRLRAKAAAEATEVTDDKEYLSKLGVAERTQPVGTEAKMSAQGKAEGASEGQTHFSDADADSQLPILTSLSPEQQRALRLALKGRNLFITGGAGSGKSLLIREIVYQLRHNKRRCVYVTATTGVAALNVRGSTVNSFAGVKFGDGDARQLLKWVRRSRRAAGRWRYCQTLIIDEISMMDPLLLDKLDVIARAIRRRNEPFGGIQVILCGDFLQLPPIPPRNKPQQKTEENAEAQEGGDPTDGTPAPSKLQYCFETSTWTSLNLITVILHKKFRQHDDLAFQQVLDELRVGSLSPESYELLLSRTVASKSSAKSRKKKDEDAGNDGVLPLTDAETTPAAAEKDRHVRLCATNKEVEMRNAKYFAALEPKGLPIYPSPNDGSSQQTGSTNGANSVTEEDTMRPLQVYRAYDAYSTHETEPETTEETTTGTQPSQPWVRFEDSTLPTDLALKVGTRVMVLQNISLRLGLVNGSVGEVVGFLHPLELVELVLRAPRERHFPSARGQELLERAGLPTLQDAFRCVDTALGQSLFYYLRERGIRRPEDASYGCVYGNTHCRDILRLVGLGKTESANAVHPLEMYLGGIAPQHVRLTRLPIVRLDLREGNHTSSDSGAVEGGGFANGSKRLPKHVYAFISPSSHQWYMGDQPVATRTQLPLRQAWAMTVHKAQGLTISHVEVAIHRFFSPGQAYVALSRSTRLDNIRLLDFNNASVHACPRAKEFYTVLEEEELDNEIEDDGTEGDEEALEGDGEYEGEVEE